jgi:DNA-binding GntR family transcriptional regulator
MAPLSPRRQARTASHHRYPRADDEAVEIVLTRAEIVAETIRQRAIAGKLRPGSHLSEGALCEELAISRNTLREAFRALAREGILRHEANRGVFVATPSMSTIIDVYRVRRMIECPALAQAHPKHPGVQHMREAIKAAEIARDAGDWLGVGSADIAFHAAIVELADSARLSRFFAQVSLELRLVFGLIQDPEFLHGPYLSQNRALLKLLEEERSAEAARSLETYLVQAERFILAAYSRVLPE